MSLIPSISGANHASAVDFAPCWACRSSGTTRSEEHTSELQSLRHLVCRLLLEKKKKTEQKVREQKNRIGTLKGPNVDGEELQESEMVVEWQNRVGEVSGELRTSEQAVNSRKMR